MKHDELTQALEWGYPDTEWAIEGKKLIWLDKAVEEPSMAELQVALDEYKAEQEKTEYQKKRKAEYPSIEDQLDMLYEDMENGTTNWQDAIRVVKQRHPKPARTLG